MRINHNIAALNTYSRLAQATQAQGKSLEKLSSGQRINKAGDDAAGLAISEKMRAQVRGLDQAGRNAQDGISMIQTAEGALSETHSILQRMRELAVQSSNDTNTNQDRTEIQKEVNQLSSEINRIAGNTEFNKQVLLDGGKSAGNVTGATAAITNAAKDATQQQYTYTFTSCVCTTPICDMYLQGAIVYGNLCTSAINCTTINGSVQELAAMINSKKGSDWIAQASGNKLTLTAVKGGAVDGYCTTGGLCFGGITTASCITEATVTCGTDACAQVQKLTFTDASVKEGVKITIGTKSIGLYNSHSGTYANATDAKAALGVDNLYDIYCANGSTICAIDLVGCSTGLVGADAVGCTFACGVNLCVDNAGVLKICNACVGMVLAGQYVAKLSAASGSVAAQGNGTTLQIGANTDQTFNVSFSDMTGSGMKVTSNVASTAISTSNGKIAYFSSSANVDKNGATTEYSLDISSASKATAAISALDDAITAVSSERSKLGAYQNRLEHTINNLSTSSENLTAAESRVRDVDMAKEMMEFTKNNILNQAATAMLAQANQQPQGVLQLLR